MSELTFSGHFSHRRHEFRPEIHEIPIPGESTGGGGITEVGSTLGSFTPKQKQCEKRGITETPSMSKMFKYTGARLLLLSIFFLVFVASSSMAAADSSSSEAKVHIVYTERPEGQEPEAYHIKTLASVFGSEAAAKESLLYSYKHAASGFSAKLTPEQVSQLSKQPGVLQVVPSETLQLHSGQGKLNV